MAQLELAPVEWRALRPRGFRRRTGATDRCPQRHHQQSAAGIFDSDAQRTHVGAMLQATGKTFEELWRARAEANPAKRCGRPGELGAYCAFLCSQHAGFITGQNLLIDGGSYPGTY